MGDAGSAPSLARDERVEGWLNEVKSPSRKQVNVLVTGFGPFKSFTKNPSWFIAKTLPEILLLDQPDIQINLYVYPEPVPVAYHDVHVRIPPLLRYEDTTFFSKRSKWIMNDAYGQGLPRLVPEVGFDHVLHIGMAGGRKYYSLETLGHRDGYKIKDINGRDGYIDGEVRWKHAGFSDHGQAPDVLHFGYDELDVWDRWNDQVNLRKPGQLEPAEQIASPAQKRPVTYAENDANGDLERLNASTDNTEAKDTQRRGQLSTIGGASTYPPQSSNAPASTESSILPTGQPSLQTQVLSPSREIPLKISHDAGHFLCDFIFFTSLAERYRQGNREPQVIFLHVPGNTDEQSIDVGRTVAEGLIKAIVGSWEGGARSRIASVTRD